MKGKNITTISLLFYLIINALFVLKYFPRFLSEYASILLLITYVFFALSLLWLFNKQSVISFLRDKKKKVSILSVVLLLIILFCQSRVDPYTLNVDRWSAIHNFLYNLLHGVYPYSAQTHLGGYGSPFPVWQIFHLPFYLLGNVGLSFVLGVFLFTDVVRRLFGFAAAFQSFVLLFISPAFLYEVIVRSDLLTNFLICAALVMYFERYHITFREHYVLLGVVLGLMASTRLSAVIPFAVYFFRDFTLSRLRHQIIAIFVAVLVFIFTFLPFIFWDSNMLFFFKYNPFVLQSRQGNLADFLLFIPLGIWLAWNWNGNIRKYMVNTACLLIVLVAVTFVHNMFANSNWNELFASAYDITYFNMALPFIIVSLLRRHDESRIIVTA